MKKRTPEKNVTPAEKPPGAENDAASECAASAERAHSSDETPTHREDFMRLLGAAARKRERED